jgi:spore germination protein
MSRCVFSATVVVLIACQLGWTQEQHAFQEIWGYLMKGEERFLNGSEPLTDIAYFSARVNDIGRLDGPILPPTLPSRARKKPRIHLVISAPASKTLMYLCLHKDVHTRANLITDIVRQAQPFDGVQIDFEAMREQERGDYISFLSAIKRKVGSGKILSVALPARTALKQDAFSYAGIAAVVDRVLIMAYDEHWRTGAPGPIASTKWSGNVCRFAQQQIPASKLVMGLPLYGRLWQKEKVARALKYSETLKLWEQGKPPVKRMSDDIPYFSFKQSVTGEVYFEDVKSLSHKLSLYQRKGVKSVGFWRIGQGPNGLWKTLAVRR